MRYKLEHRPTWKSVLAKEKLLLLPAAHDALTARLIERAGFPAYQIGGFAMVGAMHAVPDIDLEHYGEQSYVARDIIAASKLPALVDCDNGYGDVKNVTRTTQGYEHMGAAAIFMEDQVSPKKCGHMNNKEVVPPEVMEQKIRAAVAARSSQDFFILGRTDAIQPEGLESALRRGERYLKAGADGIYLEGPTSAEQLEMIGATFKGVPLATSVLENGGKTPFLPVSEFQRMGFTMILFPTTVLFRVARAVQLGLRDLLSGRAMPQSEGTTMEEFEQIVDMPYWQEIEKRFTGEKA